MIVDELRKTAAEYNLFTPRMQKVLGLIQEAAKRGKYCIILKGSTEDKNIHNKDIFGKVTINTWSILLEKPTIIKRFNYFSYPELLALKENGFHIIQKKWILGPTIKIILRSLIIWSKKEQDSM